ncbi:efflux transporter outer membrane subunit [Uliginosibacterium sediminicola]|uniref:Efflux transporter outer membrane subunit n=1 Tax=Uliginosibacterium sediminicola TaxID=2024550 RepID=A0ABU9YWG2_9RHOO
MMNTPPLPLKHTAILACLLLSACVNLAPTYERPQAPVAASWQTTSQAGDAKLAAKEAPARDWEEILVDPRLREVIRLSLAENRDLRVAIANVDKARAAYRVTHAAELPTLNASASESREHTSNRASSSGVGSTSSSWKAQLGVSSFEIDLFDRLANLSEAGLQSYFQLAETQRSVRLSLVAQTAIAWLTLAADQQQLQLARNTLESRERTLSVTDQARALGGLAAADVATARGSRDSARASVASYSSVVEQDRNALELLVGKKLPDALLPPLDLLGSEKPAALLVDIPSDLDSSILLNRPDVLAAEHTLIADNANIGAARAAFFPKITLTASGGSTSRSLDDLFASGSGAWSFAPSITLPIFDGGANRATLDSRKAQQTADIATYEKTIQTAFSEVANALAVRKNLSEQIDAVRGVVAAGTQSLAFATASYKEGRGTYLAVLDAQRTLYTAQQSLITLQLSEQNNRITLFKALGGGTTEKTAPR